MILLLIYIAVIVGIATANPLEVQLTVQNRSSEKSEWNSSHTCPIWSTQASEGDCSCSVGHKTVQCLNNGTKLSVQSCHCLWYDSDKRETLRAPCIHTCYISSQPFSYTLDRMENATGFNAEICSGRIFNQSWNRGGKFCGRCAKMYGHPAYSYEFTKCIKCSGSVLQYLAMAYGPLTLFYLVVIAFRISITSGNLNGFIFFSQVLTSSVEMRIYTSLSKSKSFGWLDGLNRFIFSLYGVWNLDFLRGIYEPFCFSHAPYESVLMWDFFVAVYPLFLVICTYTIVKLHGRGNKMLILLLKPLHKCLWRISHSRNAAETLVHAFCTFLLLSYVKILQVALDLLIPVHSYTSQGKYAGDVYYYDPSVELAKHYYIFIPAALLLLMFLLLPLVLLICYPWMCFHNLFNCFKFQKLHIFMDAILGCYRLDLISRSTAGVYLLLRIMVVVDYELTLSYRDISSKAVVIMIAVIFFSITRPYKKPLLNAVDVVFLTMLALHYVIHNQVQVISDISHHPAVVIYSIVLFIPLIYPAFLVLKWFYDTVRNAGGLCLFRRDSETEELL